MSVTRTETTVTTVTLKSFTEVDGAPVDCKWVSDEDPRVRLGHEEEDHVRILGLRNIRALAAHLTAFCDAVEKETP